MELQVLTEVTRTEIYIIIYTPYKTDQVHSKHIHNPHQKDTFEVVWQQIEQKTNP